MIPSYFRVDFLKKAGLYGPSGRQGVKEEAELLLAVIC